MKSFASRRLRNSTLTIAAAAAVVAYAWWANLRLGRPDFVTGYLLLGIGGAELAAVNSLAARQNNLPSKGVLVAKLYEGPAANAGIRQGDVIVAVNGQAILEPGDLISFLEFNTTPGDTITISIAEEGGGTRDVQVQVGARPGR